MDIDDILREADPEGFAVPGGGEDLEGLVRCWVAERGAPVLLGWPSNGLIERINDAIANQITLVEEMTGVMDPKTNFSLIVIQTELERYKFVLRSFLRARLAKIAKFALHYLSPTHRHLLSPQEITFAENHQRLRHDHYLSSFLQSFPPQLRGLEDNAGGLEMVERPDEETAVWVRMRRDAVVEGRGRDGDDVYEAVRGEVLVVRWSDVREGVGAGVMELV